MGIYMYTVYYIYMYSIPLGALRWFCALAVMNNAAMNISVF